MEIALAISLALNIGFLGGFVVLARRPTEVVEVEEIVQVEVTRPVQTQHAHFGLGLFSGSRVKV